MRAMLGMGLVITLAWSGAGCDARDPDGLPTVPALPGVTSGDEEWFWRDVLASPESWRREAAHCPGIGEPDVVTAETRTRSPASPLT